MTTNTNGPHARAADWKDLLAKRTACRGANVLRLNSSDERTAALVDAPVGPTSIDEERRCATFVISTPTPDRSEDIVSPRGVKLDNYARNPVVYYDHGFSGIQVPIGKCEDEHGRLAVIVTDEGIEGTCYFADSVEGRQIFELVKQAVLRAASINLVPLAYTIRKDDAALGRPGMEIAEWELLEWSVVGIPDNPEAVRKILAGGKLAGAPIVEPIRKSLLTACGKPEPRLLGKGFTPEADPFMETAEPFDAEEESLPAACPEPSGARVLEKCHALLAAVRAELQADAGPLEHPAVKAFVRELGEALAGHVEEIHRCYKSHYADLHCADLHYAEPWEDTFAAAARPVEVDAASALKLLGCSSELRSVRRAKGLEPRLAARLAGVETRISEIYRHAQKRKPAAQVTVSAQAVVVRELLKEFGRLVDDLRQSVPRRGAGLRR